LFVRVEVRKRRQGKNKVRVELKSSLENIAAEMANNTTEREGRKGEGRDMERVEWN
jgi:hypothetical protein